MAKVGGWSPQNLAVGSETGPPRTMLAARKWLAEHVGVRPVSLAYYFGGWFVEQLNNGVEALDRIDRLCAYMTPPPNAPTSSGGLRDRVFARPIRMTLTTCGKRITGQPERRRRARDGGPGAAPGGLRKTATRTTIGSSISATRAIWLRSARPSRCARQWAKCRCRLGRLNLNDA